MTSFSHIDKSGNPTMVDVGEKQSTSRTAIAEAHIAVTPEIIGHLKNGDIFTKKGPVFQTAIIAGIQGAKQTSQLIPLCHPLALQKVDIKIAINDNDLIIVTCTAKVHGQTGVEMEALTGASVAALTIYDMCKALSHDIEIMNIHLTHKSGGKSDYNRPNNE